MIAANVRPVVGATPEQARENMRVFTQWVEAQVSGSKINFRRAVKRDYGGGRYAFFLLCDFENGQRLSAEIQMPGCALKSVQSIGRIAPVVFVQGEPNAWMDAVSVVAIGLLLSRREEE
jgi:hypothetical protein